jgi:tyrosyl-tRNA synthetase
MIIEYLKKLTFVSKEEIEEIEVRHNENPHLREAHKRLAKEIITDLHGELEYDKAVRMSQSLFTGEFNNLSKEEIEEVFSGYNKIEVVNGLNILDLLMNMNIASSKREAREYITGNAISINGTKINDLEYVVSDKDFLADSYIIVRRGKKNYYIGKIK